MEQNTPPEAGLCALESQIRECFGRVSYSTKTHEKCADLCMKHLKWIKWGQIVLSAIVTGSLLTALFGDGAYVATGISAIVSTILLIFNTYMKETDLGQMVERHKETASKLWDIRETYLSILADLRDAAPDIIAAREKRDELQARLVSIYTAAPRTNADAYEMARDGLQNHEELTFSDAEIDKILPPALRRKASHA
ncbi:MAG TPA: hypothetical protein DCW68_06760 [Rhodospirillaceae bacterium]|nr:MAG: hypothetical protein A2018_01270 [Alphaproteobacteria bacterium GWF2_58_20]HAU29788.1 hypothetical protein [Rhodospirillaceae bacterium]